MSGREVDTSLTGEDRGRIANIGVHEGPATLYLEKLWAKRVTITIGIPSGLLAAQKPALATSASSDAASSAAHEDRRALGQRPLPLQRRDGAALEVLSFELLDTGHPYRFLIRPNHSK